MSGNAALAAARRRRGEETNNNLQVNKNSNNTKQFEEVSGNSKIHPLQCILNHDMQIFILEKKLEKLEENSNNDNTTPADLDLVMQNNNNEIKLLKNTISKQQKSIQELTSLVTSLRATVSNLETTIENLVEETKSLNVNENDSKKGIVKLDISEE
tara:strand:+ start:52 stop:519 length:468 start_codon:yes stop_codon:yes gene_type:complete